MRKFLVLAVADIEETIEDTVTHKGCTFTFKSDPVYENGMEFSGEVLVIGTVAGECTEKVCSSVITEYLRKYAEFVRVRKVEFRALEDTERERNEYRRVG
jgi:hypothetical protein